MESASLWFSIMQYKWWQILSNSSHFNIKIYTQKKEPDIKGKNHLKTFSIFNLYNQMNRKKCMVYIKMNHTYTDTHYQYFWWEVFNTKKYLIYTFITIMRNYLIACITIYIWIQESYSYYKLISTPENWSHQSQLE